MKKRLIAVITFALVLLSSCGGQSGLNDDTTSVGRYENSRIENREGSETESSARSSFLESESELSEKTLDSEQTESTTESKTEQRKQTGTASKSSQENKQQAQTGQKAIHHLLRKLRLFMFPNIYSLQRTMARM